MIHDSPTQQRAERGRHNTIPKDETTEHRPQHLSIREGHEGIRRGRKYSQPVVFPSSFHSTSHQQQSITHRPLTLLTTPLHHRKHGFRQASRPRCCHHWPCPSHQRWLPRRTSGDLDQHGHCRCVGWRRRWYRRWCCWRRHRHPKRQEEGPLVHPPACETGQASGRCSVRHPARLGAVP